MTKLNAKAKATTTAIATAAGNQRPATKNRQPPTCFSPIAERLSLPAAESHEIFVIISMFLSVVTALAGRALLRTCLELI